MAAIKFKKLKEKSYKILDKESGFDKKLLSKTFRLPSGMIEHFFIDVGKDSVQVVALTENNTILLVKQFRPGNEEINIELPGGGLDSPDENIESAARRELLEETGFQSKNFQFLVSVPYSPYSTGFRHSFLAKECFKAKEQELDPNEFLTVFEMPLETFKNEVLKAKIRGFDVGLIALSKLGLF